MDSMSLQNIVKEIVSKMGAVLGVRVHLGLIDGLGSLIYIDPELEQFHDFVTNFVKNNYKYLKIGEHSLPISGKNIMFFRLPKSVIVLFTSKGRVGQLLSFKSFIPKYQEAIDSFVGEIEVIPKTLELTVEEIAPVQEVIPSVPVKAVEKKVISRLQAYYKEIFPLVSKKIKESAKFSLTISVILNYSDGENSILDIFDKLSINKEEFMQELFRLSKAKLIKFSEHELLQLNCPTCKNETFAFIPIELLKVSPKNYIRFQVAPSTCDHTFYVILDKKGKIKTNFIQKIRDIYDEIDVTDLSIEKMIEFLGQDVFFSMFHAVFFKYSVVFLESDNFAEKISYFMKNFFAHVTYGNEIKSLSREEFVKLSKRYEDCLVIDLNSNIILNEPYETEDFDFELRLFRKVLKERDASIQILRTHSEFERLILLIDTILTEIEMYKEIKEDELIEIMKKKHQVELERSEIPVIKELADIYYRVDIRKKVIKTLVGKVSDFFESI